MHSVWSIPICIHMWPKMKSCTNGLIFIAKLAMLIIVTAFTKANKILNSTIHKNLSGHLKWKIGKFHAYK